MKIKKLFHWLYAILMFLPVFYIGGRTLYTIFNKNAKDSYSDSQITNTLKLSASTDSLLQVGQNYVYAGMKNPLPTGTGNNVRYEFTWTYSSLNFRQKYNLSYDVDGLAFSTDGNYTQYFKVYFRNSLTSNYIQYTINQQNVTYYTDDLAKDLISLNFTFTLNTFNASYKPYLASNINYFVVTNNGLDNAFEYSVNQLNEVPLFSWAQNSFLNEPFTYISGLFGIAASNPINTMLSYWLSISIIWLVFDLVMYVPLLVHRWIDKGGID